MTHKAQILEFLSQRPGAWYDDDELARALHISPRQTVNRACRELHVAQQIRRGMRGGRICSSTGTQAEATKGESLSTAQFESLAASVLSRKFGMRLTQGTLLGSSKRYSLVAPGGDVVGDARFYTLVHGESEPPSKFSVIDVGLVERKGARQKFLVFGHDRRVPEDWLERYGHLTGDVAFYFLTEAGDLERLK